MELFIESMKSTSEWLGLHERDEPHDDRIIIAFVGPMGSGKSLAAQFLINYTMLKFRKVSFASPLKKLAESLNFDWLSLYGSQDDKACVDKFWGVSGREFLQRFGTDLCRVHLPQVMPQLQLNGSSLWVRAVEKLFIDEPTQNFVIDDCRFPDEIELIRKHNGIIIRLNRDFSEQLDSPFKVRGICDHRVQKTDAATAETPNTESKLTDVTESKSTETITEHISEHAIDNIQPDFTIENFGTTDELFSSIQTIIKTTPTYRRIDKRNQIESRRLLVSVLFAAILIFALEIFNAPLKNNHSAEL